MSAPGVRPSRRSRDTRALLTGETATGVPSGDDVDWDKGIYTPLPPEFGVPTVTYGTPAEGSADEAIRTDAVLPGPPIVVLTLTNKSGGSVAAGDVVVIDTANDTAFTTTTTGQAEVSVGIAQATIANNASGSVLVSGYAALVNVPSSMTRGRYLETHTVVKQATGSATRRAGSFGQFLTGGTTPTAWLWGQTDQTASGGGSTITTKDEGSTLSSTVTTLDFTGAGVTASGGGATTTINIPGGGASYPGSVEGLFAHYKADAITGKSNNDTLTEWRNSAPLTPGFDLVAIGGAPTYQTNVVNSLPVVRFGGTAYFGWNLPIMNTSKPWTIFIVHKLSSVANAYTGLWGFGWTDQGGIFVKSNGKTAVYASASIYDGTGAITYGTTNWNYTTAVFGQTCTTRRNGSADVTGATLGLNGGLLGSGYLGNQQVASRIFSGDMAEVLVYARVLTSTEISAVETYITGKYAI